MNGLTKQQHHTAIHEAGHAVIGRVLKLCCGAVTIVPDPDRGSAGMITTDSKKTAVEWDRSDKPRSWNPDILTDAYIITLMAGAEAEREIVGSCAGGDGVDGEWGEENHDRALIEVEFLQLGYYDMTQCEPRYRRQTRRLVRRHRVKIERVAAALLEHHTLQGAEIDALM